MARQGQFMAKTDQFFQIDLQTTYRPAGPSPLRTSSSQPPQIMPPQLPPPCQVTQAPSSSPIQHQPAPLVSPNTTQPQGTIRSRLRSHKSPGSRDSSATQPDSSATQSDSSATQADSRATQPDYSTTDNSTIQSDRVTQGNVNISQADTAASSQVLPANQCRFGCGKVILILARASAL